MNRKLLVALAEAIRWHNSNSQVLPFTEEHIRTLADFCAENNFAFDRARWLAAIAATCPRCHGECRCR